MSAHDKVLEPCTDSVDKLPTVDGEEKYFSVPMSDPARWEIVDQEERAQSASNQTLLLALKTTDDTFTMRDVYKLNAGQASRATKGNLVRIVYIRRLT
jgi:hypothetical protein